ncbi:MAG: Mur ligase family protein, partial [Natronospirillum sp.]
QLHPTEIELGLDRIGQVWRRMSTSLQGVRVVTVAGTNGKGSTATLTAALLTAHGQRVGLYTSPHFLHFNERMVIAGQPVAEADIVAALQRVDMARLGNAQASTVSLTYFEFTTLAALDLFGRAGLNAVVLEVGLGGRLDAVNLIDTDCAVVTSIGLDHTDWLGDDLNVIAREKSAIARSGKPLLVGADVCHDTLLEVAQNVGAVLHFMDAPQRDVTQSLWTFKGVESGQTLNDLSHPNLPLPSAQLALQVLDSLGFVLDRRAVDEVFTQTSMPGRLQRVMHRGNACVLDVAHNPQAAAFVAQQLAGAGESYHIILGMLRDKDALGVVQSLALLQPQWHLVSLTATPRGLTAAELAARSGLVAAQQYDSVAAALAAVTTQTSRPVLICGSFFTVAEALTQMQLDTHGYSD